MKRLQAVDGELRSEYDLKASKGGVRGKYFHAASAGTNLVLILASRVDISPAFGVYTVYPSSIALLAACLM